MDDVLFTALLVFGYPVDRGGAVLINGTWLAVATFWYLLAGRRSRTAGT